MTTTLTHLTDKFLYHQHNNTTSQLDHIQSLEVSKRAVKNISSNSW